MSPLFQKYRQVIHYDCRPYHTCLMSHTASSLASSLPPSLAGCATSSQGTVATSTSWSAIDTAASTNTTESGAPTLSPSRCSRCVESSSEACKAPLPTRRSLPPPAPPTPPFTQSFQAPASSVSHPEWFEADASRCLLVFSALVFLFCCHMKTERNVIKW